MYYYKDQRIEGYSIVKCQSLKCVYVDINTNMQDESVKEVQVPNSINGKHDPCEYFSNWAIGF